MKQLCSLFAACACAFFVAGCTTTEPFTPPVDTVHMLTPEERLESRFNDGLRMLLSGFPAEAHRLLRVGRERAKGSNTPIPEKYSALMKITAAESSEYFVYKLRVLYLEGNILEAQKLAKFTRELLEEEGLPIPEEQRYIERKMNDGRVLLFLLNFPGMHSPPLKT